MGQHKFPSPALILYLFVFLQEWSTDELPPISSPFKASDLSWRVNVLQNLAKQLRQRRADNGALRLDQAKLSFGLHTESKLPIVRDVLFF